jgi:HAD superfamily hydrolase (TIGR01549 family)
MSSNKQLQATISTLLRKKVFFMAGITGSGKSTLAQRVSEVLNCEYLSSDKLREELMNQTRFDSVGQEIVDQARHSVYSLMYKQAEQLIKSGKKVVLDATHIEPDKYETALNELLSVVDVSDIAFINVKTKFATIEKRMEVLKTQEESTTEEETPYQAWKRVFLHMRGLFKAGKARWPNLSNTGVEALTSTQVATALTKIQKYKSILATVENVVWDLDGTLYPPNEDLNTYIEEEKTKRVADHLGVSVPEAQERFSTLYKKLASSTRTLNELGLEGEDFFISIWLQADFSKYIDKDLRLFQLFEKMKSDSRYQVAMLTNTNTQETVGKKLQAIGLNPSFFEPVITSVEIGYHKPDHRAFERVQALNTNSNRILYIGDKENTDIVPAKALGMKACLVTWLTQEKYVGKRYNQTVSAQVASVADIFVASPHDLILLMLLR